MHNKISKKKKNPTLSSSRSTYQSKGQICISGQLGAPWGRIWASVTSTQLKQDAAEARRKGTRTKGGAHPAQPLGASRKCLS